LHEGELSQLQDEVQEKMQGVLDSLVIDTENDHNTKETAKRVAKMYINETFGGRFKAPPRVTSFPNMGYKSMYTSGPISIRSTCAHHLQNIVGQCWVGIIPNGEVNDIETFNFFKSKNINQFMIGRQFAKDLLFLEKLKLEEIKEKKSLVIKSIKELNKKIVDAIEIENYELAAKLRDEINQRK